MTTAASSNMEDIHYTRMRYECSMRKVMADFEDAKLTFEMKNTTRSYVYQNQKDDAKTISEMLRSPNVSVVSVRKATQVGASGMMVQLATNLCTGSLSEALVNNNVSEMRKHYQYNNVFFVTGMSNASWVKAYKEYLPQCFRDNVFHLPTLKDMTVPERDFVILLDEMDVATQKDQTIHTKLRHIWSVSEMTSRNIKVVAISATSQQEDWYLHKWKSDIHKAVTMTIPPEYCGVDMYMDMELFHMSWQLRTDDDVRRLLVSHMERFGSADPRYLLVRVTQKKDDAIKRIAHELGMKVLFYNSDAKSNAGNDDHLGHDDFDKLGDTVLTCHTVVCIRGMLRRANNVHDALWVKIGTLFEAPDSNASATNQGLPGRYTGYRRHLLVGSFKPAFIFCNMDHIRNWIRWFSGENVKIFKKESIFQPSAVGVEDHGTRPPARSPASCPIVTIKNCPVPYGKVTAAAHRAKLIDFVLSQRPELTTTTYPNFHIKCWNIDTEEKLRKWYIRDMSSSVNLDEKEIVSDVILLYHNTVGCNEVLISPWRGSVHSRDT